MRQGEARNEVAAQAQAQAQTQHLVLACTYSDLHTLCLVSVASVD
jgi:hypothetical protein